MTCVAESKTSRPESTSSIDLGKLAFGTPVTAGTKSMSMTNEPEHVRGDDDSFGPKGTSRRDFLSRHLLASLAKDTRLVASSPSVDT